jgi:very-short-patch-repair endonuclease
MAEHGAGSTLTRSDLEEMFLAFYRHHRLPRPEVNLHVEAYEADFVWRSRRVIVEMDGYAGHRTRRAFERDRVRDAEHVLAGYRVLRITHRRLVREPGTVAAQLRRLLGTN